MSLDALWWAEIDDFDALAAATLSRAKLQGVVSVTIGVIDAVGDVHFVSTDDEPPEEPVLDLRALLEREPQPSSPPVEWHGDRVLTLLGIGPRPVGAVALRVPAAPDTTTWLDALRDQLAVAVDVVAARYGRRRLRAGLAALRRISARFSGALTPAEIAESATHEAVAALGASRCLVYGIHEGFLDLIGTGDATPRTRPWERIAIGSATPVADCIRERKPVRLSSRSEIADRYPFIADHPAVADQTWLAFPLIADDRPTGALFFAYDDARTFTPDEMALAATIADQCAQALARTALQLELDNMREDESEQRFRAALDAMADLVLIATAVYDPTGTIVDFRIDYMNQVDIEVAGRMPEDIRGLLMSEAYPALRDSDLFRGCVQVATTGLPMVLDEIPYIDTIDGKEVRGYYSGHFAKFGDGIIVATRDISEAREARLELEAAYEQLAATRRIAGLGIWSIQLATGEVSFSEELYTVFGLDPGEPLPSLEDAILRFIDTPDVALITRLLTNATVTGEPFNVELTGRRADGAARTFIVSGTVSLDETGEPVRLWGTAQDITDQRLAERTLQETVERLAQDHASLLVLQDAISPTLPDLANVEIHGVYIPAGEHAHVGGDWFDAMALDDGALALGVGDVAGHGIVAAALMAQLRHALRAYLAEGMSAPDALAALNRLAHLAGEEPYATCLTAIYDPATRVLLGASAGHLPYVVAHDGVARVGDVKVGPPLGGPRDTRYESFRATLEPCDTLWLFTDGLIERRGESIDVGLERLLAAVTRTEHSRLGLADTCREICEELQPAGPTSDDVCLLALRLPDQPR